MIQYHINDKQFLSKTQLIPIFKDPVSVEKLLQQHAPNNQQIADDFKGDDAQILPLYHNETCTVLIGLGKVNQKHVVGKLGQIISGVLEPLKKYTASINLNYLSTTHHTIDRLVTQIIIGLAQKNSEKQSSHKSSDKPPLMQSINLQIDNTDIEKSVQKAQAIATGIMRAAHLGNMPASDCYPESLAKQAKQLTQDEPTITCNILDENRLKEERMAAILAVGKGSARAPRLIELVYKPSSATNEQPIALVGKGVTFDSGGLSIKPASKMDEMKFDMSGAGAVIGTIEAIAKLKLPIYVVGIIPSAENMTGANAYRPGDVITTRSGQTVEVLNTDAEGRLILCDAITYVKDNFNPQQIIDLATLTGAVIVALGKHYTGLMSNHEMLAKQLIECADKTLDYVWQLPIDELFSSLIKSDIADIANINTQQPGSAGTITAACFLEKFVGKTPWAHLDIAGTAWSGQKFSTGRPVALLVEYLAKLAK